jgi:hypothetical protein
MIAALLLALTIGSRGEGPQQAPVRDTERPAASTATIRGRVTDRDTGQPLPRFRVSVSRQPVVDETIATIATATTGSNGEYELTVTPAAYLITARPPQFVSTHLAQAYGSDDPLPLSGTLRIKPAELKPNAALEVHFSLRRSLAIEGRVATEDGDPLAGVLVSLERLDRRASRPAVETDDRGYYRQFGLPPGRYRLCVAPAATAAIKGAPQRWARESLVTTCYPAEADPAHPQVIELATADVGSADLVMKTVRRFTVSGELRDSGGGTLDAGDVSFVEENALPRRSLQVLRMRPGRFVVEGVEPGTYALRVDVAGDAAYGRPREYASMEVVVRDEDVGGIVLRARRSAVVSGTLTFEGEAPKSIVDMTVTVQHEPLPDGEPSAMSASRPVRETLTFDLPATSAPARLGLSHTPPGWLVKSILYHGRDVTDEPVVLESTADPGAIEIVLTNRVVYVTGGAVAAQRGRPVVVLAFRADRVGVGERPDPSGGSSLPVAASAPADEKGAFTVGPLVPGEYLVVAVDRDEWFDASLENRSAAVGRVLPRAERLTVREGEQPSISLRPVAVK